MSNFSIKNLKIFLFLTVKLRVINNQAFVLLFRDIVYKYLKK